MAREERSLWEQYDSEVEPWRHGRTVLITIASLQFLFPGLVLVTKVISGDIEYILGFGIAVVFLWILSISFGWGFIGFAGSTAAGSR